MGYHTALIVDDSPTSRMIIQRCMEMAGIRTEETLFAENGIDALAALEERPDVDLIVSDINMPKMGGDTLIRVLAARKEGRDRTIVVTSSVADSSVESDLKGLGVSAIIKKPISPEKMARALGGNE